jgi:hypothetical protein
MQFSSKSQWHSSQRLKINHKVQLEAQKTANSQGNIEQKVQCWRYHNTWLQTILKRHSNENCMVLARKQIWRLVEQNRRPRYESVQLHPPFWQRSQKCKMEKRQPIQLMLLGKLDICMQNTETRSMFVTLDKYQLNVD